MLFECCMLKLFLTNYSMVDSEHLKNLITIILDQQS